MPGDILFSKPVNPVLTKAGYRKPGFQKVYRGHAARDAHARRRSDEEACFETLRKNMLYFIQSCFRMIYIIAVGTLGLGESSWRGLTSSSRGSESNSVAGIICSQEYLSRSKWFGLIPHGIALIPANNISPSHGPCRDSMALALAASLHRPDQYLMDEYSSVQLLFFVLLMISFRESFPLIPN